MAKLRKITMAQAEKIARAKDPTLWDSLTPSERREVVAEFNAHYAGTSAADANKTAAEDLLRRTFRPPTKRR